MARSRPAVEREHQIRAHSADVVIDADLVRSMLLHFNDLPYLQNHPLARWVATQDEPRRSITAGRCLQQVLLQAIEQTRPNTSSSPGHDWRGYRLLTWRYVEGLAAPVVQEKLALSKSEYYRDHQQVLEAVASLLRERWGRARHNLPSALTSFVGREEELTTLAALLDGARLLTLTGAGGVGKTRLAIQLAGRVLGRFPDGVWLVDLAPLARSRLVVRATAAVLGVPEAPGRTVVSALISALRSRHTLLLLDNCEHLLDACAEMTDLLLRGCPGLRVLVTSRQPLGMTGEVSWRVPSLAAPQDDAADYPQLLCHDAVRLFLDRAVSVDPTFALTARNAVAVARVCRHLDGIPLALELAAARLNALSIEQLASRLDQRYRLLTGGSRTALPRHRTLAATIDWSYDLLDARERLLFQRLSVFADGWTLEAAEAVCAGGGIEVHALLDLLARLVDKSLVLMEHPSAGSERYRLLETLRQYGRERLEASGDLDALQERHARYLAQLSEALEPQLMSGGRDAALMRLEAEHDNLRHALDWSRNGGERGNGQAVEAGLCLVGNLFWFWYLRGHLLEGSRWAELLLASPLAVPPAARAKALLGAGEMAWLLGEERTARVRLEDGLMLWRQCGDQRGIARTVVILGMVTEEPAEAWSLLEQGEALFRSSGDSWGLALAFRLQGLNAFQRGDIATARCRMEEGLALSRALHDRWFIAQTLNHLGDVARKQGDHQQAAAFYEESLALFRAQGVKGGIPSLLHNLGHVALAGGDVMKAERLFRESLSEFNEQGDQRGTAHCLAGLAGVLGWRGQPAAAARLFGAAEAVLAGINARLGPSNEIDYERNVAALRAQMSAASLAAAWGEGRSLSLEEAIASVVTME